MINRLPGRAFLLMMVITLLLVHLFAMPLISFVKIEFIDNDVLSEVKIISGSEHQIDDIKFKDGYFIRKSDHSQWELLENLNASSHFFDSTFHKCAWKKKNDDTVEILGSAKFFHCGTYDPLIVIPIIREERRLNYLKKILVLKKSELNQ